MWVEASSTCRQAGHRFCAAGRMRMEIADDSRSPGAFGSVRGDQGRGIDLEVPMRVGGDIGGLFEAFDMPIGAQQ